MSYSTRKLHFYVEDDDGSLRRNLEAAKDFCMAEDDDEKAELVSLARRDVHYSNFWGVVRGPGAMLALRIQEHSAVRVRWTSGVQALTSHTFFRTGYAQVLNDGGAIRALPVVGPLWAYVFQKPVRESLVVRDGRVVFRDLGFQWTIGVL